MSNILILVSKHEHRLLGLMLITLHIILWWELPDLLSRLFLLFHFALFSLWQPLWINKKIPGIKNTILLMITIAVFTTFLNIWSLTVWQLILLGLIGGRDLTNLRDRVINMVAVTCLMLELLIVNVHQLFVSKIPEFANWLVIDLQLWLKYGLLILLSSFLFFSAYNTHEHRHSVIFLQGLILSLLAVALALGSLIIMYYTNTTYDASLFQMSVITCLFIFMVNWLWAIFTGEPTIDQLRARPSLSVIGDFEQWIDSLSQLISYKMNPQQFLRSGFERSATLLPWVAGIAWRSAHGEEGMIGNEEKRQIIISIQGLDVTVYSSHHISGNRYSYIKLLIQLLEQFYQAKRREHDCSQQNDLKIVYETGAKLVHDIKNLLQSLHNISSIIETSQPVEQPSELGDTQRLLQGQIPLLTQRLKRTLDKLQGPLLRGQVDPTVVNVSVESWWEKLQARYKKQEELEFYSDINANILVPQNVFNGAIENLLQNAIRKREKESNIHIEVSLHIDNKNRLSLSVCDTGSQIPPDIIKDLLKQPVKSSSDGYGIGLYHATKELNESGYSLKVLENSEGRVCFEIRKIY